MDQSKKPRLIAFYLPQYHPIPENDEWWGKGFTEWTNVVKAKPLFKGHHQPHIPADLGFYDLRVPEVRQAQADMARNYGIYGFCYYHYWFNGKRLLERPFKEVLESGEPDFPFCLCWANETWTGKWHGLDDKVLIEQTYQGKQDFASHFQELLPIFNDQRYITIEGKPIFIVYHPEELPEPKRFTDLWRNLAIKNDLEGIYFLGIDLIGNWDFVTSGFDGSILNDFSIGVNSLGRRRQNIISKLYFKILNRNIFNDIRKIFRLPETFQYQDFVKASLNVMDLKPGTFPSIIPNWDNSPRARNNGIVLKESNPELFSIYLTEIIDRLKSRPADQQVLFIKSWNEWAEGNYLEPDQKFGKEYLQAIRDVINQN